MTPGGGSGVKFSGGQYKVWVETPKGTALVIVYGLTYLATALVFLGIDTIWLSVTASLLYRPLLGGLLRDDFDPIAAAFFYILYIGGIVVFVIAPSIGVSRPRVVAIRGAFFGLVAYATYDLTNQATLRNWPLGITIADLCWGSLLTAIAATAGHAVAVRLSRGKALPASSR
jgi:uncharacterized membrane protein